MKKLLQLFGFARGLTCSQVEAVLQQYLDSELEPREVPKVLAHLEKCKDCGLEAETYERIRSSLLQHQQAPDADSMARIRTMAHELAVSGPPEGAGQSV